MSINKYPIGIVPITTADTPSLDGFGRLRVSNPQTVFDSRQLFDKSPLFWDDQEISGTGTTSVHSTDTASTVMGVALNTAGHRVRQTFMRFNYQPGKSQLIFMTCVLGHLGGGTGITRSYGTYDDNNGIFFRDNEGTLEMVVRSFASGAAVDNAVAQSSWNLDKLDGTGSSGVTFDNTKSQIFTLDYEWLGVGRVRVGFVINGITIYVHEFLHANVLDEVFMSTPDLPLRIEIENDGTGVASETEHICATVISEGGVINTGAIRYASTAGTPVGAATAGTIYAILGLRLKSTALACTSKMADISIYNSTGVDYEWLLILNPTVAGTFTYADETSSCMQVALGATANTVTGGTLMIGGFVKSSAQGQGSISIFNALDNAIRLGAALDDTPDTFVLCARPLSNNASIEGSMSWRELSL